MDFSIASYVLKMYMANEGCAGWLGAKLNALHDPMRARCWWCRGTRTWKRRAG